MNGSPYLIEHKFKEQHAKQKQGKGTKVKGIHQKLISTQLSRKFLKKDSVNPSDIKTLARTTYKNPVISLYLTFTADSTSGRHGYIHEFNSLKHEYEHSHKKFLTTLPHDKKVSFRKDLKDIEEYVKEFAVRPNIKTVVIFKSGDTLHQIFNLPFLLENTLVVNHAPYLMPLEELMEEQKNILVIQANREAIIWYRYRNGGIQEITTQRYELPSDLLGKHLSAGLQRHIHEHLHHFVQGATRNFLKAMKTKYEAIFVAGEAEMTALIEQSLPADLSRNIREHITLPVQVSSNDLLSLIQEKLHEYEMQKEEALLEEMAQHKQRGELVSGIGQVIEAQNRLLVAYLIADKKLEQPGFVCRRDWYFSLDLETCVACGGKLSSSENILDDLLEVSRLYNINHEIIQTEPNEAKMDKFGGIAAILRGSM